MTTKQKKHRGLTALLVILLVLALLAALPLLYGRFVGFSYDNVESLLADDREPFEVLGADGNGSVLLRFTKADLYALLARERLAERALAALGDWGRHVELQAMGLTIAETRCDARVKCRLFGLIPVQLKLEASLKPLDGGLAVTPQTVYLGRWISMPVSRVAALAGRLLPDTELTLYAANLLPNCGAAELRAGADALTLSADFPARAAAPNGFVRPLADVLYFHLGEDAPPAALAAREGRFPDYLQEALSAGAPLSEALGDYIALADSTQFEGKLTDIAEAATLIGLDRTMLETRHSAYLARLADEQRKYEALLTALRDAFRENRLELTAAGFSDAETKAPLALSSLTDAFAPDDEACRVILQYSFKSTRPVRTQDMPRIDSIPRSGPLPEAGQSLYDLAIALRAPCGLPVLLYYLGSGELVFHTLSEADYAALLAQETLPVLCTDDVPKPPRWDLTPAPAADLCDVFYLPLPQNG